MNIFKEPTGTAKEKTLKKSDFKEYYPDVNSNMPWDELKPYIDQACSLYVSKHIDIETALQDEKTAKELKYAVAFYTIYLALPHKTMVISSLGAVEPTNDQTMQMSLAKMKNIQWTAIKTADKHIDNLLEMMPNEDSTDPLVPNRKIFTQYQPIKGMRAYLALLPFLKKARKELAKKLCKANNEVLERFKTDESLQDYVREYICAEAMYLAVPHLAMVYDGNGFMIISETDTFYSKSGVKNTFTDGSLQELRSELKENKANYLQDLQYYLNNDATFVEWHNMNSNKPYVSPIITPSDGIGGIML